MKKFLKYTAITLGVLFVIFLAIGFFLGNSMESIYAEAKQEAESFAKTATKDQCLEEYADKYLACEDISCFTSSASFGVICLAAASGSKEEFCRDKPKSQTEFYSSDWKDGLCKSKGLNTQDCLSAYKIIETHCSN